MNHLGDVLSTARRASGLTQEELSTAAGVTQAALSRWENGLRMPGDDELTALAHALGVTTRLFDHAGRVRGAMAVDAHMRRRGTAQATVWRRLEARLNMYRIHASLLTEEISIRSDSSVPQYDPVDVTPAEAARFVRMQWGLPVGPVKNLTGWIEAAGCLVIEESFGTPRVDGMSQWVGGLPIIFINIDVPTDRKRLTLAHELGHLVLHTHDIPDDPEEQANAFAAELLMPLEVIRPQLRQLKADKLHHLKQVWGVSMAAIVERAYRADLMSAAQRTSMYKMFSARGWRKIEPGSDRLPPEAPQLTTSIADALLARGLNAEEIAHIAGFPTAAANRLLPVGQTRLRSV